MSAQSSLAGAEPSGGRAEVNGLVPHRERIANARRVGAVFGQRSQLWWDLPARDSLSVLADIHGVGPELFRERVAAFDRILELSAFWDTRARQLSLGEGTDAVVIQHARGVGARCRLVYHEQRKRCDGRVCLRLRADAVRVRTGRQGPPSTVPVVPPAAGPERALAPPR